MGLQESIPDTLSNLCNTMSVNGSVCQAFKSFTDGVVAYFLGQAANTPFDLSQNCWYPASTMCVLNAGIHVHCHASVVISVQSAVPN